LPSKSKEPLSSASLRARAIAALARREHSRKELEKKLGPLAETAEQLCQVLDHLQGEGLLSDQRFAESVSRVRGQRYGTARVVFELRQKGVAQENLDLIAQQLRDSEWSRIQEVWKKRFESLPETAHETARQQRFLLQRGFPSELIYRLFRELRA
jgi:regulatory protein